MSFEFPFEYAVIPGLGRLFYPIVWINLKTVSGWQPFEFLVDTGADTTTLPLHLLPVLGLKKQNLTKSSTLGVGSINVPTWEFRMPVRLGHHEFTIHTSAVEDDNQSMPLLLGRKGVFEETHSLFIDSKNKKTVIMKNESKIM